MVVKGEATPATHEEIVSINSVSPDVVEIAGFPLGVFQAPPETRISVESWADTRALRGPGIFDAVVDFRDMFVRLGMCGATVPELQRWQQYQRGAVTVLQYSDDQRVVSIIGDAILSMVKNVNPDDETLVHLDPRAIARFWSCTAPMVLVADQVCPRPDDVVPVVAARAGIPMTGLHGFRNEQMMIFDAKRLNIGRQPGNIAVGLRLSHSPADWWEQLAGKHWFSPDPALATASTQLALFATGIVNNACPKSFTWTALAASQQGLELAIRVANQLRQTYKIDGQTISCSVHPTLTGGTDYPYYIKTADNRWAIGDAGDKADLLLEDIMAVYRRVWPPVVTERELALLNSQIPEVPWDHLIKKGTAIILETMVDLQQQALKIIPNLPPDAIGKAIKLV